LRTAASRRFLDGTDSPTSWIFRATVRDPRAEPHTVRYRELVPSYTRTELTGSPSEYAAQTALSSDGDRLRRGGGMTISR
jgi:hypothetical protein